MTFLGTGDTRKPSDSNFNPVILAQRASCTFQTRTAISWRTVEPQEGLYNWTKVDILLRSYIDAGLLPTVLIGGVPSWTRPSGRHVSRGPDKEYLPYLARFINNLVSRFPSINIEVMNEVELLDYTGKGELDGWFGRSGDYKSGAKDYVDIMKAVFTGYHSANGTGYVIPCFACDNPNGTTIFDFQYKKNGEYNGFISDFVNNGGPKWCDAINIHYYMSFERTWGSLANKINWIRGEFERYGYSKLPIYLTEVGARTSSTFTREDRARWLFSTTLDVLNDSSIKGLLWFRWADKEYGVLDTHESPTDTPEYYILKALKLPLTKYTVRGPKTPYIHFGSNVKYRVIRNDLNGDTQILWMLVDPKLTGVQSTIYVEKARVYENIIVFNECAEKTLTFNREQALSLGMLGAPTNSPIITTIRNYAGDLG